MEALLLITVYWPLMLVASVRTPWHHLPRTRAVAVWVAMWPPMFFVAGLGIRNPAVRDAAVLTLVGLDLLLVTWLAHELRKLSFAVAIAVPLFVIGAFYLFEGHD